MKPFALSIAALSIAALSTVAHAAQIASPAIYGSTLQRSAQCVIGNTSTKPIAVDVRIVDEAGNAYTPTNQCGTIEPSFLCSAFINNIPNNQAVACTATAQGSTSKLRGNLTIFDAQGNPLRTEPLR